MATVGLLALYMDLKWGAEGRAMRLVIGNWMPLAWNCMVLARLQAEAGTVAVLIICTA